MPYDVRCHDSQPASALTNGNVVLNMLDRPSGKSSRQVDVLYISNHPLLWKQLRNIADNPRQAIVCINLCPNAGALTDTISCPVLNQYDPAVRALLSCFPSLKMNLSLAFRFQSIQSHPVLSVVYFYYRYITAHINWSISRRLVTDLHNGSVSLGLLSV